MKERGSNGRDQERENGNTDKKMITATGHLTEVKKKIVGLLGEVGE